MLCLPLSERPKKEVSKIKFKINITVAEPKIMEELNNLLDNQPHREKMMKDYEDVRNILGGKGASEKVAKAMVAELEEMIRNND